MGDSNIARRVRRWTRGQLPSKADFKNDAMAGLPGAISSVPDGMAASVLAGVSPVHGLYASFAGPIAGGMTASTRLMMITTTSAAALAAGSAIEHYDGDDRAAALFLLTLVTGAVMIAAGLLHLGRYTRFVSHSVMIGFLTGVALNIILGQLQDLVGVDPEGSVALSRALWVVTHPGEWDARSLLTGLTALVLVAALARTRLAMVAAVIALVVPTVVLAIVGFGDVSQVRDVGDIPRGVPLPQIPQFGLLSFSLISGALAVAVIVLVQGTGVSESAPNPGGSRSNVDQDFKAQGIANVACGFFRAQPVGGSVGQTSLNLAAGARTRWASILSGVWMLIILVAFSGLVGQVAMPTLAAVLIVAAVGAIRLGEGVSVWKTGPTSQVAMATTFVATLFLPVAAAVGIGVALSLLLQLNQEALDLCVVELYSTEDGAIAERPGPTHLTSGQVTVLEVYGSLFYAGARTLQARLPDPAGTHAPAVVLRLRGRTTLGATFFDVIAGYAAKLAEVDGTLILSGVSDPLIKQMRAIDKVHMAGPVHSFAASEVLGESTRMGFDAATTWTVTHHQPPSSGGERSHDE